MDLPELHVRSNYVYYVLEFCLNVYDTLILDVSPNISVSPCSVQWISLTTAFVYFQRTQRS
jgi:hypothetical protein